VTTTSSSELIDPPPRSAVYGDLIRYAGSVWAIRAEAMEMLLAAIMGNPVALKKKEEEASVDFASGGKVAVIPLAGVITPRASGLDQLFGMGGGNLASFRANLSKAAHDPDVDEIVLDVDSPGGLVDQVPETAAMIREVSASKPVTAVANTQAASAAYWLASQANEVVLSPSGEAGSIGVYMAHTDTSEWHARRGLHVSLVSAGKYKTEGNMYEPLDDEGREAFQDRVNNVYGMFVNDVAEGRRVDASEVRSGYGEGRLLSGEAAVHAGLVDRIDSLDGVINGIVTGQSNVSATQRRKRLGLLELGIHTESKPARSATKEET
jgi:signal peptide peptidase SppA